MLSTEGSQFFADIECNFDEVASIVTNDVDRDLELKQDGPVFEVQCTTNYYSEVIIIDFI